MTDRPADTGPAPQDSGNSWFDKPESDQPESDQPESDHITPDIPESIADVEAAIELAEAERAVTLHVATAEQADGVARAARERQPRERRVAWQQRRRMADTAPDTSRAPVGSADGRAPEATTAAEQPQQHDDRRRDMAAPTGPVPKDPQPWVPIAAAAALIAVLVLLRRRRS